MTYGDMLPAPEGSRSSRREVIKTWILNYRGRRKYKKEEKRREKELDVLWGELQLDLVREFKAMLLERASKSESREN